ncbi:MAG: NYN domain-containing protein [Gammaproteobacteria bacterium]
MASSSDNISMAVFCDFENVALGVRDANYEKFDIKPVLERLLLKGSIVVKKAYCDWDRYKGFKATMHEANFELIEIPHVRQSGKNSADIRLVVDALDLCYTKSHVNTFVIISGDSDFSPLVSKLRENAKQVIGVGVKQSTSDLLVANCDEFIFYDDLVRESKRAAAKRDERKQQPARRSPDEQKGRKEELDARKTQALELVVEMFDALVSERGDSGKIWASLLKDTLKRRRPDFNETYYGFRTFGNLLEEAQSRGLLEFGRDEKSGAYVYRSAVAQSAPGVNEQPAASEAAEGEVNLVELPAAPEEAAKPEPRRRGRGGRKQQQAAEAAPVEQVAQELAAEPAPVDAPVEEPVFEPVAEAPAVEEPPAPPVEKRRAPRGRKKAAPAEVSEAPAPVEAELAPPPVVEAAAEEAPAEEAPAEADAAAEPAKPARKAQPRGRRPVKPKAPRAKKEPKE